MVGRGVGFADGFFVGLIVVGREVGFAIGFWVGFILLGRGVLTHPELATIACIGNLHISFNPAGAPISHKTTPNRSFKDFVQPAYGIKFSQPTQRRNSSLFGFVPHLCPQDWRSLINGQGKASELPIIIANSPSVVYIEGFYINLYVLD